MIAMKIAPWSTLPAIGLHHVRWAAMAGALVLVALLEICVSGPEAWMSVAALLTGASLPLLVLGSLLRSKKQTEEDLRDSLSTIAAKNRSLQEYATAAEAATLAKNEFLANMSHELRTPLNAIIGFSDGLLERSNRHPLNDHQKDRLAKIKRSGEHLLSLINNVLDISKIEAREHKVIASVFDVAPLVQEVVDLVDPLLRNKPEVVLENLCLESSPLISSDRDKIKQVLINLIGNAIKFTNRGRVTVRANVVDGRVLICVEDTGIGIAAEDLPHIFDKFYQVKQIRTSFDGTGLGLSICKAFAELLGGAVKAHSLTGRGSAFTLDLPLYFDKLQLLDHEELVKRARSHCGRSRANRGPTVLCIEDNPADQLILNDILGDSRYRMTPAFDGQEGLQAVRDEPPDVIVLDIMLPGVSGWQVLRQLKHDPDTRDIPVIMTSSLDDKPLGLNLGADEYFVKPLESASLRRSVERLAHRWKRNFQQVAIVESDSTKSETRKRSNP
jgi:signal transduction histidine kinase/CheY-like chemotaxis protein